MTSDLPPGLVVVVGLDPGDSCGLVSLQDGVPHLRYQGTRDLALRRLEEELQTVTRLREGGRRVDAWLACERYVDRRGPGVHQTHQPAALQVAGRASGLAARYGVPFELQSPADAKQLADNHLLRRLGLYTTAREVDCRDAHDVNDATRHALLCLARHHATLLDRLLREASVA